MIENLFSVQGLSLDRLKNFLAYADTGSIVAAAGKDHVKQSLYSRQIRELSEFFGVELVKRQGRGLVLTDAGCRLAMITREQFGALADFAREAKDLPATVSVVAPNSITTWFLMPKLAEFRRRLPRHRLILQHAQTADIIRGVQEGAYDLGFLRGTDLPLTVGRKALGPAGFALFFPKILGSLWPKGDPDGWVHLPLALPIGGTLRGKVNSVAERKGFQLTPVLECDSYVQAAAAVESGGVASILPRIAESVLIANGVEMREVPQLVAPKLKMHLIWSKRVTATRSSVREAVEVLPQILMED